MRQETVEQAVATVPSGGQRDQVYFEAKTEEAGRIPLHPDLEAFLRTHKQENGLSLGIHKGGTTSGELPEASRRHGQGHRPEPSSLPSGKAHRCNDSCEPGCRPLFGQPAGSSGTEASQLPNSFYAHLRPESHHAEIAQLPKLAGRKPWPMTKGS
jgi:hypothetical protein